MICPKCQNELEHKAERYECTNCKISLPAVFYGYKLQQKDIDKLVLEGMSDEIEFYSQTKKKKFTARLVFDNNRVEFEFQHRRTNEKAKEDGGDTVSVFLSTVSSGIVKVFMIDNGKKEERIYDFGTKATRYAHALSLIGILPLIPKNKRLKIISDDFSFVKYALGEATPRDREIRIGFYVLSEGLKNYTWSLEQSKPKKQPLKGGNSKVLSGDLFPYISVKRSEEQEGILVEIENCNLAVEVHFLEYMQKAKKLKLGKYIIPKEAEHKLDIWCTSAKGN